jgi:predicted MPP superfamily phosphohydrolase
MGNINNIEKTENEQIKELFKELSTSELYDIWADTFEIEDADDRQVLIAYHGDEKIKVFRKACKEILFSCVCSVLGEGKKIKIVKKRRHALSPEVKKNIRALKFFVIGMIFVCMATAIIVVLCNYIGNRNFRETFYNTSSIKVDSPVRVIQLSDLHNTSYGKDNKKLLERIEALEPDIIICTGDIVNSANDDIDYALSLAEALARIAPSYYVYGNNEVEDIYGFSFNQKLLDEKFGFDETCRDETALLNIEDSFEEKLESVGIKVLKNEKDTIKVKTMTIDVYGVLNSNPSSFWSYSGKAFSDYIYQNPDNLKITAVHEPFIFEAFQPEFWGDLMVCGHTHGGVIRVPVIGPLYTNEGGLFPERAGSFVYGRYSVAGKPLIVSAGLENGNVFRINNQPELVVIDINKF